MKKIKLSKKEKTLYGILGFLALLIISNPSPKAFKEYCNGEGRHFRSKNFFVCSIYKHIYGSPRQNNDEYIGVFSNFLLLHHEREPEPKEHVGGLHKN